MKVFIKKNIHLILVIVVILIILGLLMACLINNNNREGLEDSKDIQKLTDYTNSDPNIKPTPLPDYCIGNGKFSSQPKLLASLTKIGDYPHSNIGACENECTLERGCFGISFDRDSKAKMKPCTTYTGSIPNENNSILASSLCSRNLPKCGVNGYKLNSGSTAIVQNIAPPDASMGGNRMYTHSNEKACAVECTRRDECIGYNFDSSSKLKMKPCFIYGKSKTSQTKGYPMAGICSKN